VDLARNLIGRINVGDSLTRTAAARPGQLAVMDGERRLSYADFNAYVNRLAHGLAGLGYERGAALALASGNSADFLAVYYACAKLGVVCVPINLGWQPDEVAYVLGHSAARGIVVESQLLTAMQDAIAKVPEVLDVIVAPGTTGGSAGYDPPSLEPADRAWTTIEALTAHDRAEEPQRFVADRDALSYLYTSGTTSFPKGVVGSHLAIYLESMSAALDAGFRADDRFAAMMPLFHTAQLNGFGTPAVLVGATTYVLRGFDPAALLDLIERERITQIFGLPIMYRTLLDHDGFAGRDLSSLRRGDVCDGADARRPHPPLPGRVRLRLRAGIRTDRNEPGHHLFPARAPALAHRCRRHPGNRRPGRDHGSGRRAAAAGPGRRDRLPGAEHHVRLLA
jgi:acyl-CoA synthetase (AMP-forming)/AMP-acid ligase II